MRRSRERGSIMIYVAMCLLTLGILFAAVVPLAGGLRGRTTRRTDELRARLAFESGVATIRSQSLTMTLTLGTPIAVSVNGVTGTVTPAANDTQLANTLLVTGTMTRNGRSYRYSRVIGARQPDPFSFAICTKSPLDLQKSALSGSSGLDGDLWSSEGDVRFRQGSTVNGNVFAKNTIDQDGNATITGRKVAGQASMVWPTLSDTGYRTEASNASLLGLGLGTYYLLPTTFLTVNFQSPQNGAYDINYFESNLTLKGPISGKGTLYVKGNLTINGDVTYANAASEVAIVVHGDATISGASNFSGYLYCDGTLTISKDLAVPRGALVATTLTSSKGLTVTRDNAVRDDTDEAVRLRLPYYWP